jgi:hypothetical protein
LERSASVADLARLLIDTYQIDLERASQDAERFLWELSAAELIVNE